MNIYFSGIGGVGLGPLAQIAADAGYRVQGSDLSESLTTNELQARGVPIDFGQDGTFLQACHQEQPIDWFVYTAALPESHPELQLAKRLGIKISKRDELLAHIIADKQLKLIALAGTHGKTTATGMMVWSLQQLGIPVSYSIGSTISFGPSGKFDPASEYFVYECDEFDRNFLHFSPYLSLITALDYDHPDTYPSEQDYLEAFAAFGRQSEQIIAWDDQHGDLFANHSDVWLLKPSEVQAIKLPGHNRRNGTLVLKGLEKLGIDRQPLRLHQFPGTDRRFERLGDYLYSDYGHHPVEIASTLQLARELVDHVVLVYQPHQNVRQHELLGRYTDQFEQADIIYWLPTYLSREDPELEILTPQDLTATVTNRDKIQFVEFDNHLWQAIQRHREAGHLVLCMGAGSIDSWIRSKLAD